MRAGYLWYKLEMGLMRVGEPYRGAPRKLWGVALLFFGPTSWKNDRPLPY